MSESLRGLRESSEVRKRFAKRVALGHDVAVTLKRVEVSDP